MGSELRRMIRDGAPPAWTPLMRLVASEIADDARDPSQRDPGEDGSPWSALPIEGHRDSRGRWRDGLTERTGATADGISHALTRLARAGYEMREPIGKDKRGRPVFAARGHAVRFRVPPLLPRPEPQRSLKSATFDAAKGRGFERQRSGIRASKVGDLSDPIPSGSPHVPSDISHPSSPADVEGSRDRPATAIDDQDFSDKGQDPCAASRARKANRGACSHCGQEASLTVEGTMIRHADPATGNQEVCQGSEQPPARTVSA